MKRGTVYPYIFLVLSILIFPLAATGASGEGVSWTRVDTYRVLNFIVLLSLLAYFLKKPISVFLNGRIRSVKEELAELEGKKKEAEIALIQTTKKLMHLQEEIESVIDQYVVRGNAEKEKILQEMKETLSRMKEQMNRKMDQRVMMAKKEIRTEVVGKALVEAEKIIRAQITPEDQSQLMQNYIKEIADKS